MVQAVLNIAKYEKSAIIVLSDSFNWEARIIENLLCPGNCVLAPDRRNAWQSPRSNFRHKLS